MTPKDRDVWMITLLADQWLDSGAKCLGQRIGFHFNLKTEQCNPGYQRLADGTGMKLAAIPKQLKRLETRGFIKRVSSKGRYTNSYLLTLPTSNTSSVLPSPATTDGNPGLTAYGDPRSTVDQRTGLEDSNPIPSSASTTYADTIEPPMRIHTNTESYLNTEKNTEEISLFPSMSLVPIEQTRSATSGFFQRFYAAYPRKREKGDAESTLNQILKKRIATEDEIMAGVIRLADYWSKRPKADLKFCPYPAKWLRTHAWADELEEPRSTGSSQQADEMYASVSSLQSWGSQ